MGLESTANLALRPRYDTDIGDQTMKDVDETDFVNAQAIVARAMCQAMAFPNLQPAIVQLFSQEEETPTMRICPAAMFVPYSVSITFADVIRQVKKGNADDICVGWRAAGKTVLCPQHTRDCNWNPKEEPMLLIISRSEP